MAQLQVLTRGPTRTRVRKFSRKVSTGCGTCKIRRIKCDEAAPVCTRCKSTGRKCDGYQQSHIRFLRVSNGGIDHCLPNLNLAHNTHAPEEARALQFYRERTALKLSGHSHSDFWLRLVLQVSCSDLAVKHMIITLASIEEALDTTPDPWPCYGKCIKYHSKAIGSITRSTPPPPVEVVLIFSLLFATYYNMQGKSSNALDHVENGLNIIREWRASHSPDLGLAKSGAGSEVIEEQIGPVFADLEEQISDLHSHPEKCTLDVPKAAGPPQFLPFLIPRAFGSFDEARNYLRGVMSLVTHAMQLYSLFPNQKLDSIRALQARNYLHDWQRSFETCKKSHPHQPFGNNVSRTCILLEIHYRIFCIMFESFPIEDEMRFDSFNADFVFVIAQSRALITQWCPRIDDIDGSGSNHSESTIHNGQLGLIPPLFLTATRCRVPHVRRQALSLLRQLDSVEGVWNSKSAARIAEQVMLIEERGLDMVRTKTQISEHRRVRLSSAEFDVESGKLLLKFSRFPHRQQDMLQEEEIIWPAHVSPFNRIEPIDPVPSSRGVLRMAGYHNLCDSDDACSFAKHDACYGKQNFAWACKTWARATAN